MEDLENQLGSARCEYLRANLNYRHSAFACTIADVDESGNNKGVAKMQTKLRTTFTAAISRYNAASPWSPPPAPAPNRLLKIIAAH